jgi:hypothetical protein
MEQIDLNPISLDYIESFSVNLTPLMCTSKSGFAGVGAIAITRSGTKFLDLHMDGHRDEEV